MSNEPATNSIAIPESLARQLHGYRRTVRQSKMLEAAGIASMAVAVGFLSVFAADRMLETATWFRWLVFFVAASGVASVPIWFQRWVLRYGTPTSLARLMTRKDPALGDSLLGAIELSSNLGEQSRSPALCRAALEQVAETTAARDLKIVAPDAFPLRWWAMAGVALTAILWVCSWYPAAASNAWLRFAMPWKDTARFTFAELQPIPSPWIVPHGEPLELKLKLTEQSMWKPDSASLRMADLPEIASQRSDLDYRFELPPRIQPTALHVRVGDARRVIPIEPVFRPQLTELEVTVKLPEYLQRPEPIIRDARSGTVSTVYGSQLLVRGQTNRDLIAATLDASSIAIDGAQFASPSLNPLESATYRLRWTDSYGLSEKLPFDLQVSILPDAPPSIFAEDLPRSKIILDSEQIRFRIRSSDDFGVRRVGMEWRTAEGASSSDPVHGEWILAEGNPRAEAFDAEAVFQATALNIPPQPIELRLFVEDFLPDRGRIYSSPSLLVVLNASDHAVWVLQQLNRWQREALEVRDRELQLLSANTQLRSLDTDELAKDAVRAQIQEQAAAEQANARRLSGLNQRGDDLLRQAARNPEIGVGHLEKWAEIQQILKDIASNRMPSVADLLKQAAKAESVQGSQSNSPAPKVAGSNRDASSGPPPSPATEPETKPAVPPAPQVVDRESSQQPIDGPPSEAKKGPPKAGSLGLPTTTVAGAGKSKPNSAPPPPASASIDAAVEQQLALLKEFDKVAEELNKIMANLEGSTLVKRFKAASREQIQVADSTGEQIAKAFGNKFKRLPADQQTQLQQLSSREANAVNTVGLIIDDLEAFHERRPMVKFRDVIEDVRSQDPLGGLRKLSQQLTDQQGLAISEAEYWSDTFDRWAEDLIDPACKGECPGSKSKGSLPPSLVLEVMQILEGEMNLRDRTRVVEQSKDANEIEGYERSARELADNQTELQQRVSVVIEKIQELPNAAEDFAKDIQLMQSVDLVMREATSILARPETGRPAVAAETEAIELLLQSKRINPKGGGGGGSNPGGGGSGETTDAAIAMIGPGMNEKEIRQDHGIEQASGTSGSELPEEFRHGLDQYFERVDRKK